MTESLLKHAISTKNLLNLCAVAASAAMLKTEFFRGPMEKNSSENLRIILFVEMCFSWLMKIWGITTNRSS